MLKIGVIGYGFRIRGVIDVMQEAHPDVRITAITDIAKDRIEKELSEKGGELPALYTDPEEMLDREDLDGVMVGTRCSLHSKMAGIVLRRNLPLYLEKPVATNMRDLLSLRDAGEKNGDRVVVSFPLRVTPLVGLAKEIIDSGKIGTVEHVEAFNNVPYGQVYFQDWYRDENETGGLFLQKATHDFDYINYLVGAHPTMICAMTSKQVYKGDRPAGLRCEDCGENRTCADSPYNPYMPEHSLGPDARKMNLHCSFAVDTGNEDSGSALIRYETGMHASYTQNFVARKSAGKRGAILVGYKGTIEFDWYTDTLKVHMHHTPRVETYKLDTSKMSHEGGDLVLTDNFVKVIKGEEASVAPLSEGLMSVLMCLAAKESAKTSTFQEIKYPDGGSTL